MESIIITCPHCNAKLSVPKRNARSKVRCGRCKEKFVFEPPQPKPVEDVVASWLTDEPGGAGGGDEGAGGLDLDIEMALAENQAQSATGTLMGALAEDLPSEADKPVAEGLRKDIRVVKVDGNGTLIEFAPGLLRRPEFRTAFPRQCVRCDSRAHLNAHVVIFSSQLVDSVSMEAEHKAGALALSDEEVQGLSDEQILDRLPAVPNVPPPADLPMPFWICDMCTAAGQVSGQIRVNAKTGGGFCRLLIRHPRRALAFLETAVGRDVEGFDLVRDSADRVSQNPWDNLPEGIRHRIEQWYHPMQGEQFLAYVPDRDHTRTEDGMAGVVITNQRLIAHFRRRHREAKLGEPIELTYSSGGGKGQVAIQTTTWSIPKMAVDRDGIARMRRGLSLGKFKAVWH